MPTKKNSSAKPDIKRHLSPEEKARLLEILRERFEANMVRHKGMKWKDVLAKLEARADMEKKLWCLSEMEKNGHEPDVVDQNPATGQYLFFSCSEETPAGHRNIVYDRAAEEWLKKERPDTVFKGNAVDIAAGMGVEMLDEEQYMKLQSVGNFDRKTWSWVKTPPSVRETGAALHGYRGDDYVGVYHGFAYVRSGLRTRAFRAVVGV